MSIVRVCPTCGIDFIVKFNSIRKRCCSKSCARKGELNSNWKGDNVGYAALHEFIGLRKELPSKCSRCGKNKKLELSSINHSYTRDVKDWEWLCRKCHYETDEAHKTFLAYTRSRKLKNINCKNCSKEFHPANSTVLFCSLSCSTTYMNIHNHHSRKRHNQAEIDLDKVPGVRRRTLEARRVLLGEGG